MRYQFIYRNTAADLWQLSMYYMYGSMVGVCNVIFTAAVFALALARWESFGLPFRCLLVLGCCLFTVIQPLAIYFRSVRQARDITEDTIMRFDDKRIYIQVGNVSTYMGWERMKRISKKPTMIILFSDTTHGYVLTNRVLGRNREDFYKFLTEHVKGRK